MADRRFFTSERGRRRRVWAEEKLGHYGIGIVLVCRFIPGGRTAVTLVCGVTEFSRRRFVVATAISAVVWASYAFFPGRVGGKAFENKPWLSLLLALGAALMVSVRIEAIRRLTPCLCSRTGDLPRESDGTRPARRRRRPGPPLTAWKGV